MANRGEPSNKKRKIEIVNLVSDSEEDSPITAGQSSNAPARLLVNIPPIRPPPRLPREIKQEKPTVVPVAQPVQPRKVQVLDPKEQEKLDADTSRREKHKRPKTHRCHLCKCRVPRGWDTAKGDWHWNIHQQGAEHIRNVQLQDETWQHGCTVCPGKKFNSKKDFDAHVASPAHQRAVVRRARNIFYSKQDK